MSHVSIWIWIPTAYVLAVCIPLTIIDIREHRLPNKWVVPGYGFAAVGMMGNWIATEELPLLPIASGILYFGFLLALAWFGGMGMGDVKLAGVLGCAAGLWGIPVAVASPVLAFFLAGALSALMLGMRAVGTLVAGPSDHRASWKSLRIPFGPFMLAGFLLAVGTFVLTNVLT